MAGIHGWELISRRILALLLLLRWAIAEPVGVLVRIVVWIHVVNGEIVGRGCRISRPRIGIGVGGAVGVGVVLICRNGMGMRMERGRTQTTLLHFHRACYVSRCCLKMLPRCVCGWVQLLHRALGKT